MIFEDTALEVIRLINETNDCVFLTGKAGTGKSTLVRYIMEKCNKIPIVIAPTGIAATNIGGCTIHSMFGIPIGMYALDGSTSNSDYGTYTTEDLKAKARKVSRAKKNAIRKAELLIIDEVSMLRADLLDGTERMLRIQRNSKKPFGGMQVLFVGDMMQLPPVLRNEEMSRFYEQYDSEFFFDAKCLNTVSMKKIELKTIHRQTDIDFITVLNNLRLMQLTQSDIDTLNQCVSDCPKTAADGVYITTHNYKADMINDNMISKIAAEPRMHFAEIEGYFNVNGVLAMEELTVKVGMRIMTIINQGDDFFNGKLGTITDETEGRISVIFDDGNKCNIFKHTWENISMEYDHVADKMRRVVSGTFTQFPVKPAYAITVHKSQGLSFDKAILDINEVFAGGQAYTALSRLRSINGLTLMSVISPDVQIKMNTRLIEFIRS